MKGIKYVVMTIGFALLTTTVNAQSEANITEQAQQKTALLTKELKLNDNQNESVSDIVYGIMMKNEGIKKTNYSQEEKNRIYKENKDAEAMMLKNVLTPEQFEKYKKLMAEKK